jgi:hypothetical protein
MVPDHLTAGVTFHSDRAGGRRKQALRGSSRQISHDTLRFELTMQSCVAEFLQITALAAALLIGNAWPSAAQLPDPNGGRVAIGGMFGGALPTAERLDNGLFVGATLLVSIASHAALSAEAGADRVVIDRPGFRSELMPRFAGLNLLVHLRSGAFRPFITGGGGVYRYTVVVSSEGFIDPALRDNLVVLGLSPSSSARIRVRHDEPGANLGGGFEYFFGRRSAMLMDVRAHATRDFVEIAPLGGVFVNAAIGYRQYF